MQALAHVRILVHAWAHMWLPPYWGQAHRSPALQERGGDTHSRGLVLSLYWCQVAQSWDAPLGMGVKLCQGHLSRGVALQLWDRDEVPFGHWGSRLSWGYAVWPPPPRPFAREAGALPPLLLAVLLIRSLVSASSLIRGFLI